jgi:hypothetical protein
MFALASAHSLLKVWVARKTEGGLFLNDHPFDVARMRVMAGQTHPFCKRVMVRGIWIHLH